MSWNGSGQFNRLYSWVADKAAGLNISSSRMDADSNDIASNGFGNCLTRDGQGAASANLPMNTFRHTGVGDGVARTDYASLGQLEDGIVNWAAAGGSADALTVTLSPAVTALKDGQVILARAGAANATTTPTLNVNGLGAATITKRGGAAVVANEWLNLSELIFRYNLANTRFELLNPGTVAGVVGLSVTSGKTLTVNNSLTLAGTDGKTLTLSNSITLAGTDATTLTGPSSSAHLAALDLADQTLSGGANVTSSNLGTKSSGTLTIDCGACPLQYVTNGGAFTLAAPANDGSCLLLITNNASAGAITFSGFTVGSSTGDPLTTTNTNKFLLVIARVNGTSTYLVKALQ